MTSPRRSLFMHTAYVHLGGSPQAREERAFVRAIDFAIEAEVDAVLVVGDLFDHARVADDLLEWTADLLKRLDRPVVILPGNHDTFHEKSVYHRLALSDRCPDAILLDDTEGAVCEVPGTDVVIWGRAMVEHEPAFRPLAG